MKLIPVFSNPSQKGFALITALVLSSITLLVLMSSLDSASSNTRQTMANAQYFTSASAAEAATEKVLSKLLRDYQNAGDSMVFANLASYSDIVPSVEENPFWSNFDFNNGDRTSGKTFVSRLTAGQFVNLDSEYSGF